MLTQAGEVIVNTASTAGLLAQPRMGAYAAAKHGVVGITQTAAKNIRINAVCPGVIGTPPILQWMENDQALKKRMMAQEPIGRAGRPRRDRQRGGVALL
jgi:NAD(P)-dependent dehydrogenase (short-subunit alcohol dehydrogenase family)